MNTATCHVLPIGIPQESTITPTGTASLSTISRRTKKLATNAPDDQDLMEKEKKTRKKESKDGSDMEEDPMPKPSEKAEAGACGSKQLKNPEKGALHTFLGPPTTKE
jgi:hypothetical protein